MSAQSRNVRRGTTNEIRTSRIASRRPAPRRVFFLVAASALLLVTARASAAIVTLDFATLPSAQGWTYFGIDINGDALPENDVYSVDGTTLTQNMVGGIGDRAQYNLLNALDEGMATTLRLRARVTDYEPGSGGSVGLGFRVVVHDGAWNWQLTFTDSRVHLVNGTFVDLDTSEFHDYRLETRPDGAVEFFIDDVLRDTTIGSAISSNAVAFGDSTGTGENADVEITEFSLTQSAVPEPGTLAIWSLLTGIGVAMGYRHRRK